MHRPVSTLLVALLVLGSAPEARADGVERCQELYVDAAFDAARRCVATELAGLGGRPSAIRDAYALLAATELADEHEVAARRAVAVALAVHPGFEPEDPVLRAPRILALFQDVSAEIPGGDATRGIFPVLPVRADSRQVRLTARVQGVHPPLTLALRHRTHGPSGSSDWHESRLSAAEGPAGLFGATIRPPVDATSTETEFLVQTPDGVPVLRVAGPNLTREAPRAAPPATPRRPVRRTLPAPPLVARTAEPRADGDAGNVWLWSAVGAAGLVTVVITALMTTGEMQPLFRIQL